MLSETKFNVEKYKQKYIEAYRAFSAQEKKLAKTSRSKIITSDDEINKGHEMLYKYSSQFESIGQIYKYEINKANKVYEDCEKRYEKVIDKIRSNEESRVFFIKCHIDKFSKIFEEFTMSSLDFVNV